MPSKNHGKKIRPLGRILHSVSALTGQTSYISPEPKRCAERKALNCLARIVAKFRPLVGGIRQKFSPAKSAALCLLPWNRAAQSSTHTTTVQQNLTRNLSLFASRRRTCKTKAYASPPSRRRTDGPKTNNGMSFISLPSRASASDVLKAKGGENSFR